MSKKTVNSDNIRKLTLAAILAALIVVLQVIGGFQIGPVPITLTLIPIIVGAILLGPVYGTGLGLVFGAITIILVYAGKDPFSLPLFERNAVAAWTLCLVKGAAAGFCPAIVFKAFHEKKYAPSVLVALSGAFIAALGFVAGKMAKNAGTVKNLIVAAIVALVAAGYLLLVRYALKKDTPAYYLAAMVAPVANTGFYVVGMMIFFGDYLTENAAGKNIFLFLIAAIAINFIVEFATSVIISPSVASVAKKAFKPSKAPKTDEKA